MPKSPVLTEKAYHKIRSLVRARFGIALEANRRSLVMARLQNHVSHLGFDDFEDYIEYVTNDSSGRELAVLADRLSTNHTFFNRESEHFDFLEQEVIPSWRQRLSSNEKLRIWSAGCSRGEEAYQLAMVVAESFAPLSPKSKAAILGTDLSNEMLKKARQGLYSADNVAHLKKEWISKYFVPKNGNQFEVKDELKELILFRRLNLMRPVFPFKHKFHIIFCRNVLIYFDAIVRRKLIERFHHYLLPGGVLFIGHAENIDFNNPYFKLIRPSIFVHEAQP